MSDIKFNSDTDNTSSLGIIVELPLKFNVQNYSDTSVDLNAQNKLAFDIADTFSHSQLDNSGVRQVERKLDRSVHDENVIQNRLLEKKLTVVIQLLNTLLANNDTGATLHSLKLGVNSIEWDNAQFQSDALVSISKDQNLLFSLYPASELAYPIKRSGVVVNVEGSVISVKFHPLDSLNQERFEKWIFQLHRRSLQHKNF